MKKHTRLSQTSATTSAGTYTLDDGTKFGKENAGELNLGAGAHSVSLELQIQPPAGQAQLARGAGNISVVFVQSLGNHAAFDFGQRVGQRDILYRQSHRRPSGAGAGPNRSHGSGRRGGRAHETQLWRKVFRLDQRAVFSSRNDALHLVAELAHVPGPFGDHQQIDCLWLDLDVATPKFCRIVIYVVVDDRGNLRPA